MQMSYFGGPLMPTAGEAPGVSFVLILLKTHFHDHYFLAMSLVHLIVTTVTFWIFLIIFLNYYRRQHRGQLSFT